MAVVEVEIVVEEANRHCQEEEAEVEVVVIEGLALRSLQTRDVHHDMQMQSNSVSNENRICATDEGKHSVNGRPDSAKPLQ